jgi:uncharacterized protein (TIGR02996 family)
MTEADAFLEDVLANPQDDTQRRIFADWLEDRGGPADVARAELIRLQCELARLPERAPGRAEREARARALQADYEEEWLGPLGELLNGWELRRGFVECVTAEARVFLEHAEELFRLGPVWSVKILDGQGRVGALAFSRHLARLTALDLGRNGIDAAGAGALAASAGLRHLITLDLRGNPLGDDGLEALATSRHLTALRHLNLRETRVGDRGLRALAAARHVGPLFTLDLTGNRFEHGFRPLAGSPATRGLVTLYLHDHPYRGERLAAVLAGGRAW